MSDRRYDRGVIAAVIAGFALRVAWVTWATTSSTAGRFTDAANYLRIAGDLANGILPRFGGQPSAYFPVGYPATLVPLEWFTSKTGWLSMAFAAALLNVVAGTVSIIATARLAAAWVGRTAAAPAAWFMAIGGGQLYFTSSYVTETLFIAVMLTALVLLTSAIDAGARWRRLVLVGVVVGYAVLVRTPGVVLLAAPALMVRARRGSWRGSLRPTLTVLAGAAVLLVPWTVRNGIQVGVWTPASTNNAVVMCIGHRDGADGGNTETLDLFVECYAVSPYDNPALYSPGEVPAGFTLSAPDEAHWYRSNVTRAVRWAATHPADEARLVFWKTYETLSGEPDALWASRQFTDREWPSPLAADVLNLAANAWQWVVLSLALLGLAFLPACRRALPIWGLALAYLVMIWGGVAQAHYKLPAMPLVAILAGAVVAAVRSPRAEPDLPIPAAVHQDQHPGAHR